MEKCSRTEEHSSDSEEASENMSFIRRTKQKEKVDMRQTRSLAPKGEREADETTRQLNNLFNSISNDSEKYRNDDAALLNLLQKICNASPDATMKRLGSFRPGQGSKVKSAKNKLFKLLERGKLPARSAEVKKYKNNITEIVSLYIKTLDMKDLSNHRTLQELEDALVVPVRTLLSLVDGTKYDTPDLRQAIFVRFMDEVVILDEGESVKKSKTKSRKNNKNFDSFAPAKLSEDDFDALLHDLRASCRFFLE